MNLRRSASSTPGSGDAALAEGALRRSLSGAVLVLVLFASGCASAPAAREPSPSSRHSSAAALFEPSAGPEEMRLWVDSALLSPYEAHRFWLTPGHESVESYLWFPYAEAGARRHGVRLLEQRCAGPIRDSGRELLCRLGHRCSLTEDAKALALELRAALHALALPVELGSGETNPEGTITVTSDATLVEAEVTPFSRADGASFTDPSAASCRHQLCQVVDKLLDAVASPH